MLNLNSNAIKKFILPNTINLVILDGIYRADLSSQLHGLSFAEHTLQVPVNFKLSIPIKLLFFHTKANKYHMDIIAESNSSCTIIETHINLENKTCNLDIAINITVANNSNMDYYKIYNQSYLSNYQARTVINQYHSSQIKYGFMGKGVGKSCDILQVYLLEEHSDFETFGVMDLDSTQILNYKINIEHLASNCLSKVLFKGVIADSAIGDFGCKVLVHPHAHKTETHVINKNLLLSQLATMNTEPSMEIYTDDVNATHGATVGQLDQEAIFYLRCRGMAHSQAIELLTKAFTQEIIEKFGNLL